MVLARRPGQPDRIGGRAMPSNFSIIRDDRPVKLPDNGKFDITLNINAPGIDVTQRSLLIYRVDPPNNQVTLELEINNKFFRSASFSGEARTFHDVVGSDIVQAPPSLNTLKLTLSGNNASILVSDIVLLYAEK